jgi:hypothetical protein
LSTREFQVVLGGSWSAGSCRTWPGGRCPILHRPIGAESTAFELLELSADERRFIETKLALAAGLRQRREHLGLTQTGSGTTLLLEPVARGENGSR